MGFWKIDSTEPKICVILLVWAIAQTDQSRSRGGVIHGSINTKGCQLVLVALFHGVSQHSDWRVGVGNP